MINHSLKLTVSMLIVKLQHLTKISENAQAYQAKHHYPESHCYLLKSLNPAWRKKCVKPLKDDGDIKPALVLWV